MNNNQPFNATQRKIIVIFALTCLIGTLLASGSLSYQPDVKTGNYMDPVDGKHYLTAFVPLKSGWGLMLARKIESVLSEIRPIIWGATALVGCLFFMVSFIGILVARKIVVPAWKWLLGNEK